METHKRHGSKQQDFVCVFVQYNYVCNPVIVCMRGVKHLSVAKLSQTHYLCVQETLYQFISWCMTL